MKTSLAIVCVISLAQISFGWVASPSERAKFEEWSLVTQYVDIIGAPATLEVATCVRDTIAENGALHGFNEKIINELLGEIATLIASGNMGYDIVFSNLYINSDNEIALNILIIFIHS